MYIAVIVLAIVAYSSVEAAQQADLTNYESYPDPHSEECIKYHGCDYVGEFAFVDGKKSEEWVKEHNIIAVHEKFGNKYKLKKFKITQNGKSIEATVYDECSDKDCEGCCTENMKKHGFLIDMEKYTVKRAGFKDGVVTWECLDC